MTTLDTRPYCANCGWQVGAPGDPDGGTQPDIGQNRRCDSCGSDLLLSGFSPGAALPGLDPPPPPNAVAGSGEVVFTWAVDGATYPEGYDFGYSLAGANPIVTPQATSPQTVTAAPGVEVCGALQGHSGGIASGYSVYGCDVSGAVTLEAPPEDSPKAVLLQWLSDQGVTGVETLTKRELWSLIRDLLD